MNPERFSARNMTKRMGWALMVGMVLFSAPPLAGQTQSMNFFVIVQGSTRASSSPAIYSTDARCQDAGYTEGFGHLTWRVYLTGTAADGEEGQIARGRIGEGPWFNARGVEIAANLDQLHSDGNNLSAETALTIYSQAVAEGLLEIPPGSQMDGGDFSREGPFF